MPPPEPSPQPVDPAESSGKGGGRAAKFKLLGVLAVIGLIVVLRVKYAEEFSFENLAARQAQFEAYRATHPTLIYGVALLAYVLVTALSLPLATPMTLIYGWLFGFWRAVVLVSFASTIGATAAFLLCRYLLRDAIQAKFGDRLQAFNRALEQEGAFYLLTLRLIPIVPFFMINAVMGLTPIRVRTYYWVSQLGMFPATCAYIFAASRLPSLEVLAREGVVVDPWLLVAFAILGVLPLAIKKIVSAVKRRRGAAA